MSPSGIIRLGRDGEIAQTRRTPSQNIVTACFVDDIVAPAGASAVVEREQHPVAFLNHLT
jgi:hypothetical protein